MGYKLFYLLLLLGLAVSLLRINTSLHDTQNNTSLLAKKVMEILNNKSSKINTSKKLNEKILSLQKQSLSHDYLDTCSSANFTRFILSDLYCNLAAPVFRKKNNDSLLFDFYLGGSKNTKISIQVLFNKNQLIIDDISPLDDYFTAKKCNGSRYPNTSTIIH